MPKRGADKLESYESDGGFVENDDGEAPKTKKTKKSTADTKSKGNSDSNVWELSSGRTPRRVEISEFKGKKLVNIREFYEKEGDYLPGKKGISLTLEQYRLLLKAIPEINASLSADGIEVEDSNAMDEDQPEADVKPKKRAAKKETKSNIDETSDEE